MFRVFQGGPLGHTHVLLPALTEVSWSAVVRCEGVQAGSKIAKRLVVGLLLRRPQPRSECLAANRLEFAVRLLLSLLLLRNQIVLVEQQLSPSMCDIHEALGCRLSATVNLVCTLDLPSMLAAWRGQLCCGGNSLLEWVESPRGLAWRCLQQALLLSDKSLVITRLDPHQLI